MSSNKAASMETRIDGLKCLLQPLIKDAANDEPSRKQLLDLFQGLSTTLAAPSDTIWSMIMQPPKSACLKTALDMGLIQTLNERASPMSVGELSAITEGEAKLIARILRALAATGIVEETGYQEYAATEISKALDDEGLRSAFTFDASDASLIKMPEFLSKTGYKNPTSLDGIFQFAHNTKVHNFEWTNQDPRRLKAFKAFMGGHRQKRTAWFEAFPVKDILFRNDNTLSGTFGGKDDDVLMVDVAGGAGYDLESFRRWFPHLPGRLILQDVPNVIDSLTNLHEDITPMKYDFFTPQPIKGARAYYFRTIFHDWSDSNACEILRNTKTAMTSASKILINEWILPDVGTPAYPALLDIQMMGLHSGMERTEKQWRELLGSVGLSAQFHKVDNNSEGLIEATILDSGED